MFGFIHRLYIEHLDDDKNPLIYLQLCVLYRQTGVYKAGKSYMIRSKTKTGCLSKFQELRCLENIIPNPNDPTPFTISYGSYTIKQHKQWQSDALSRYVHTLTKLDDAFYYITDLDKRISYLEDKLLQLRPDLSSILLSTEVLFI